MAQWIKSRELSRYWAQHLALHEPERFFTAGLIHNIGELVVVIRHPETAVQCASFTINEQLYHQWLWNELISF